MGCYKLTYNHLQIVRTHEDQSLGRGENGVGFIVSALNHTIHGESNPKTGLTKRQFIKDANGNVTGEKLIYLKKGLYREIDGTLHNGKLLYNHALNEPVKDGVLTVFAHGNRFNINYLTKTPDIQNMFLQDSVMWNNFKSNGGNLTMDLKSCSTGIEGKGLNISQALTYMNKGLTIYAPANYYNYNGTITNNAGYNKYYNGSNVDWTQNR